MRILWVGRFLMLHEPGGRRKGGRRERGTFYFFLNRVSRRRPAVAVPSFSRREKPRVKDRLAPPIIPKFQVKHRTYLSRYFPFLLSIPLVHILCW